MLFCHFWINFGEIPTNLESSTLKTRKSSIVKIPKAPNFAPYFLPIPFTVLMGGASCGIGIAMGLKDSFCCVMLFFRDAAPKTLSSETTWPIGFPAGGFIIDFPKLRIIFS